MSAATFWNWTERQRQKRDYSWSQFEKRAGMSNGGIKKRYEARDVPSVRVCAGIAKALNVPIEAVMHRAGVLPHDVLTSIGGKPSFKQVLAIMRELSPQQQREILNFAKYLLYAREREK